RGQFNRVLFIWRMHPSEFLHVPPRISTTDQRHYDKPSNEEQEKGHHERQQEEKRGNREQRTPESAEPQYVHLSLWVGLCVRVVRAVVLFHHRPLCVCMRVLFHCQPLAVACPPPPAQHHHIPTLYSLGSVHSVFTFSDTSGVLVERTSLRKP